MQIFEKLITVTKSDLDRLEHVNNVRYLQWICDIAKEHWLQNTSDDINKNFHWVVLSHYIEYKSSAILNAQIKIKTFVKKSEGVTSTRIVEMYHLETNKLIVKSESNWCFMNSKTKRPARITPEIVNLFT